MDEINWGFLLFSFDGRLNRSRYWAGQVLVGLVTLVLTAALVFAAGEMKSGGTDLLLIGAIVIYLAAMWPWLAINIKRWHDRDKSGLWILIGFVPVVGPIWALIETGFHPGTTGSNRYGPDPRSSMPISEGGEKASKWPTLRSDKSMARDERGPSPTGYVWSMFGLMTVGILIILNSYLGFLPGGGDIAYLLTGLAGIGVAFFMALKYR